MKAVVLLSFLLSSPLAYAQEFTSGQSEGAMPLPTFQIGFADGGSARTPVWATRSPDTGFQNAGPYQYLPVLTPYDISYNSTTRALRFSLKEDGEDTARETVARYFNSTRSSTQVSADAQFIRPSTVPTYPIKLTGLSIQLICGTTEPISILKNETLSGIFGTRNFLVQVPEKNTVLHNELLEKAKTVTLIIKPTYLLRENKQTQVRAEAIQQGLVDAFEKVFGKAGGKPDFRAFVDRKGLQNLKANIERSVSFVIQTENPEDAAAITPMIQKATSAFFTNMMDSPSPLQTARKSLQSATAYSLDGAAYELTPASASYLANSLESESTFQQNWSKALNQLDEALHSIDDWKKFRNLVKSSHNAGASTASSLNLVDVLSLTSGLTGNYADDSTEESEEERRKIESDFNRAKLAVKDAGATAQSTKEKFFGNNETKQTIPKSLDFYMVRSSDFMERLTASATINKSGATTKVDYEYGVPLQDVSTSYSLQSRTIPVGILSSFAGTVPPEGWLICDGTVLPDLPKFKDLEKCLGQNFGTKDGRPCLPDLRGRVLIGAGQGPNLINRELGSKSGEEKHTLTVAEMPAHEHDIQDPGHFHNNNADNPQDNLDKFICFAGAPFGPESYISGGFKLYPNGKEWGICERKIAPAMTNIKVKPAGNGQSFNLMPPSQALTCIIKY